MGRTESKQYPLGRFPYKVAISREELAIGFAHREQTGESIQTFVRRLIREHSKVKGSERFTVKQLALELNLGQAPSKSGSSERRVAHGPDGTCAAEAEPSE